MRFTNRPQKWHNATILYSAENQRLITLENGIEYSRSELQTWLNPRSRICSTPLWSRVLEGKEAFEVGDYTYKLKPCNENRYLVKAIKTSALVKSHKNKKLTKRTIKCLSLAACLIGGVLIFTCMLYLQAQ